MDTEELISVKVKNKRSLGKLGEITVFLTPKIKSYLDKEKSKTGETLFALFTRGMAMRGFKHLVEKIRENDSKCNIVFTDGNTEKSDNQIFINYEDYKKSASDRFFPFYREVGLDAASFFLNQHFPQSYVYNGKAVSESDIKTVDKNFSQIIDRVPKKGKNKKVLIDQTSKIITELSTQKKLLKQEIQDLETLRKNSNIFFFKSRIEELKVRLTKKYHETRGKNSWQRWIYDNNWLFGINYQQPIEKQKISILGSMPDFSFPTIDGFLDILEIKLPTMDIITPDHSHVGCFSWSSDTNKAIGQVVNYLTNIELYQLHIKDEIKRVYGLDLYLIKPRAIILIGNKNNWTSEQHKALRNLNYSLHGIEVLSYTDLINRGLEIIENYNKKYESTTRVSV